MRLSHVLVFNTSRISRQVANLTAPVLMLSSAPRIFLIPSLNLVSAIGMGTTDDGFDLSNFPERRDIIDGD